MNAARAGKTDPPKLWDRPGPGRFLLAAPRSVDKQNGKVV